MKRARHDWVMPDYPEPLPVRPSKPLDAGLIDMLQTIVRDFNGNTSAFFRSLQANALSGAKHRHGKS